jgi:FkbM family methyltransferase
VVGEAARPTILGVEGARARGLLALLRLYARLGRGRGLQRFAWEVSRAAAPDASALVAVDGVRLRVYLSDGYWVHLLFFAGRYEPEIEAALERVIGPHTPFIDCGANIGYWSLVAAVRHRARVVAIEPAARSFERLTENVKLNGDGVETRRAAVWSSSGVVLSLVTHARRHAGASVVNRRERIGVPGYGVEEVETVTLDQIYRERFVGENSVAIKLDVEDAEVEALRSARELLDSCDALLIYEDHGNDPECRVSQEVLKVPDYGVYRWNDGLGFEKISTLDDMRRIKVDGHIGYNFFALREDSRFLRPERATRFRA